MLPIARQKTADRLQIWDGALLGLGQNLLQSTQIVVGDILFNLYRTLIHPFDKQNQSLALILRLFSDIKRHPRFIEAAKAFYALPLETCGKCSLVCGDPSGGTLARPGSPWPHCSQPPPGHWTQPKLSAPTDLNFKFAKNHCPRWKYSRGYYE